MRRFPPPWAVERIAGGFKVLDASNGSHQTPGAILNFEVSWFPFALRRYCREADKERETFERVELCF
jgi:hypothetical protein